MDETEYRSTYTYVNQQRCKFEKSILSRRSMCRHAHRFCLADREGVACQHQDSLTLCERVLAQLRQKAVFALKLTRIDGPLPHAKEVKVQTGSLIGLAQLVNSSHQQDDSIEDIITLIETAIDKYGHIDQLPYDEITRGIVQFRSRRGRK